MVYILEDRRGFGAQRRAQKLLLSSSLVVEVPSRPRSNLWITREERKWQPVHNGPSNL